MNEVNSKQSVAAMPSVAASSKKGGTVNTQAIDAIKQVAAVDTRVESKKVAEMAETTYEEITAAITKMNEFVQSEQRNLSFSVDESTGITVVKVVDKKTGELIRQMPNQTFLELAEHAKSEESFNLISTYG